MSEQQLLFGDDEKLREFEEFHAAHPKVYDWLHETAVGLRAKGWKRYSLRALFHVYRFHTVNPHTDPDFKINDKYSPYYARRLMREDSRLAEFFELRRAAADAA